MPLWDFFAEPLSGGIQNNDNSRIIYLSDNIARLIKLDQ